MDGHPYAPNRSEAPPRAQPDRLPLVWFKDIEPCLDTSDFVQGLLVQGSAVVVYGESNAGKTFWTLDLSLHVAAGIMWNGRRVEQGGVIYCVLEGSSRFRNRVTAWRSEHNLVGEDVPFAACEAPINLLDPKADTDRLIQLICLAAASIDVLIKLVVIDTLSRALAGGNENAPDDMGALVANMDRVKAETGAAVLFVHHSGKDQARGARGHSLLRAAVDTEIEVVDSDGAKMATIVKQRDMEKGGVFPFQLDVVELGRNRHDEAVTTCIVVPTDEPVVPKSREFRLTPNNKIGVRMLSLAFDRHGKPLPPHPQYPPTAQAVTEKQWRDAFYQGFPGENEDTKRRTFNRVKKNLLSLEIVISMDNFVWFKSTANG